MRRILIDTNIYSFAMKGDEEVIELLRKVEEIGFSVVSVGELLAGFKGGGREQKNREELEEFLDSPRVVVYPVDDETAEFYSDIFVRLKKAGTPIPTNGIWIAAIAYQNGLKLYTKDVHFKFIEGLPLV